jgi:hypothetical protein
MSALQMICRKRREFFRRNAATRYCPAPRKRTPFGEDGRREIQRGQASARALRVALESCPISARRLSAQNVVDRPRLKPTM